MHQKVFDDQQNLLKAGGIIAKQEQNGVKILLLYDNEKQTYVFPKGHIEPGEIAEECIVREMKEETGLDVEIARELKPIRYTKNKKQINVLLRMFLLRPLNDKLQLENEGDRLEWFEIDEAIKVLTHKYFDKYLAEVRGAIEYGLEYRRVFDDEGNILKAGAIVFKKENFKTFILLTHRKRQNDYSFPKGHIEEGEVASAAAIREIKEETGCDIKIISELPYQEYNYPESGKVKVLMYLAECTKEGQKIEENEELVWTPIDEVEKILSYDNLKEYFRVIKGKIR